MLVPETIRMKIKAEKLKKSSVPPIIRGWAMRAVSGKETNQRQLKMLLHYLPKAGSEIYDALGGIETDSWARKSYFPYIPPTAMDESTIDVLGLPYWGPNRGRDSAGDYFDPSTDFMDELIPLPPAAYVHGMADEEKEPVGDTIDRWYDDMGGWFRIRIDPSHPRYQQLISSHKAGMLRASTGVIPAFYDKDTATGHVRQWLVGEISLVDLTDGYRPVNSYAIAKAAPVDNDIFSDYYGTPVEERRTTLNEMLHSFIDRIRELISTEVATGALEPSPEEIIEDAVETALSEENNSMDNEEKCEACDEAAKLKAELEDMLSPKCERCPGIIQQIRSYVKAGKLSPKDALPLVDKYTTSDEGWDDFVKAAALDQEDKPLSLQKATPELFLAGGQNKDTQNKIDENFISKQVARLSIPKKEK